jgi:acyl-CoA synthetase (AMP-forming)/AMP-acid ligase II
MDIIKILEENSRKFPAKQAIIFKGQAITFTELRDLAYKLADSLKKLGLKKGDRAAIYLPNWPEYIYCYLGLWCSGLTVVPLDFMLTEDELISCISHAEAKVLIAKPKANLSLANLKQSCPLLKEIIVCHEKLESFLSFEELLAKGANKPPKTEVNDRDYAIIFYTSGTTGRPKGVLINYRQLEAPAMGIKYFVNNDITENDTVICALPFSHLGGLIGIQVNLAFGVRVVLMERFLPSDFLRNIEHYKVNWFWLVPSMYYALLQMKEFESFDLSSLRWIDIFGAPSSADAMRRFHSHCPQALLFHGWGLTETNAPTAVNLTGSHKYESVGKPAPWIEVKIFDENDKEVVVGEVGEVVVRGWVVSDGYYKDHQATAEAMRSGWFHTGDLGRLDAEGYLYIVGRKKEMIKVAGEIVFEPEVENALHKHPDIAEAAVIGVADNLRGEVPKAFVVLKEGSALSEEDLRYFCRQHLAHFKIPHYFEFTVSLPKNRVGKIDKEKLKTAHPKSEKIR